jgi:hypothetical protein
MFEGIKNNNVRNPTPGYFTPIGKLPTEFNDTIFRSTLKQVLPVKGQPEAVTYGDLKQKRMVTCIQIKVTQENNN